MGADHLGHLGALVGERGAKVLGGLQVPGLALGPVQHVVGDRPDQGLGEGVLTAFRGELVRPDDKHLLAHERAEQLVEAPGVCVGDGLDRLAGKAPTEDRALLDELALVGAERVEAGSDESRESGRDLELSELADEMERGAVPLFEDAFVEEAPHGLDGVQGDPLRTLHDAGARSERKPRHEAVEHLADDLVGKRVEREGRDGPA